MVSSTASAVVKHRPDILPRTTGDKNGWGWAATAGAVELILRVFESSLNTENLELGITFV